MTALIILTAVSLILRAITPEQEVADTPPITSGLGELSKEILVTYTGPEIILPETMDVYDGNSFPMSTRALAETIAQRLAIPKEQSSSLPNTWTNYQTDESIDYREHENIIYYLKHTASAESPEGINNNTAAFDTEQGVTAARQFIQKLQIYPEISPVLTDISYTSHEISEPTAAEADSIEIPFTMTIDSFPIKFESSNKHLVSVRLDKEYQVNRVIFYPPPPTPLAISTKETLSSEAVLEQLTQGNMQITLLSGPISPDVVDLTSVRLTDYQVEYRYEPTANIYLPYLSLSGSANSGQYSDIRVLLPAIYY